ncbi:MAG: recombinase family protein [Zhenhengia sp.]|jgi:DNA invertase Pin-like site-specific DNA recombinase|uniref:recombinase family protein n=1 Tax=Zhenhengia sp. TaxID=2944208 RepID=UPI002912F51E|nr:recombinase family protein [Clostridiales bacterium]MDU6974903.1 recombinase family protein [Clostridiales bacterium]
MNKVYGYCRISTKQQNIERQQRNILGAYPTAILVCEAYTGTKIEGRKEFEKLLNKVKAGDTIVFDSVSRMSRNAEEGFKLYEELMEEGINLVFLKEHYIDTDVYKNQLNNSDNMQVADKDLNETVMQGIRAYLVRIIEKQIRIAFEQAEKEVKDLRQRTREGIETARLNGKQIGQIEGAKLITKKSIQSKEQIKKYSKDFDGTLNDIDTMKIIGISRNSYYKYKNQLREE